MRRSKGSKLKRGVIILVLLCALFAISKHYIWPLPYVVNVREWVYELWHFQEILEKHRLIIAHQSDLIDSQREAFRNQRRRIEVGEELIKELSDQLQVFQESECI